MQNKEKIQYATAVAMVLSGIVMAFMSFFVNGGDIPDGVLWYVAQALTYAGGIFGVSIYFRTKLGELENRSDRRINEFINSKGHENRH